MPLPPFLFFLFAFKEGQTKTPKCIKATSGSSGCGGRVSGGWRLKKKEAEEEKVVTVVDTTDHCQHHQLCHSHCCCCCIAATPIKLLYLTKQHSSWLYYISCSQAVGINFKRRRKVVRHHPNLSCCLISLPSLLEIVSWKNFGHLSTQ